MNGSINRRDKFVIMSTGRTYQAEKVGVFTPKRTDTKSLETGEVGYVIAGIKEIDAAPVGIPSPLPTIRRLSRCRVSKRCSPGVRRPVSHQLG